MTRDVRVYLHDVLTACEAVTAFVKSKTFEDYDADLLLRSGVERQLGIVGEAVNQAVKLEPTLRERITSARWLIDLRNPPCLYEGFCAGGVDGARGSLTRAHS